MHDGEPEGWNWIVAVKALGVVAAGTIEKTPDAVPLLYAAPIAAC